MDDALPYLPIASIVLFLVALFGVYRSLAAQKDAVVESLKQQVELLKLQLEQAKSQSPDAAAQTLADRVAILMDELSRLKVDAEGGSEAIKGKERELERARSELEDLRSQVARAEHLFADFSCPSCREPMVARDNYTQTVNYMDDCADIDYKIVQYRCGCELTNGIQTKPCGRVSP